MQSLGMESSIIMLNFPALQGWHMLAHVGTACKSVPVLFLFPEGRFHVHDQHGV